MAPSVPIEYTGQESRKCALTQMMGKTRKFSKGHLSSGFVPDYRHAVETMGESEGFGSSGRVDAEMTASEDSYAPKRKCISLNGGGYDNFGVPTQVLSLSKMSQSERRDLELRLKVELEQVRTLQRKIASLSSNVVLSPLSDIHSCSDGKKRPPLESVERPSEVHTATGKRRAPPGRNGSHMKRSHSGRVESVKRVASLSPSNAMVMKQCETLLKRMMGHQHGWVFNVPVDVVKLNIPDYFTVITHPMDLGTVKSKLVSGLYSSPLDFAADVRLTFSNAMTYNPRGNDVHFMAETLSKFFETRWKLIEKKLPVVTVTKSATSRSVVDLETESVMPPSKKKKNMSADNNKPKPPVKRIMTDEEKHALSIELESLLAELPNSIVDFLREHSFNEGQTGEDEIEIDIDALDDDTLFMLRKLLDDYLLEKQKEQGKVEPCEMERCNESRFSNLSMQPCKGNDTVDEDVDIIGGNDPPIAGYPPVEIEKDTALKNSRCSSSSSSSSESGSSSSDSDSGCSSGSDSDEAKPVIPAHTTKETLVSGGNEIENRTDQADSVARNQSSDGVVQIEQNSESKALSAEMDEHQDGESAPSERQVSPEKLYRAALLRSRFADTILKAQEKTLEKSEKMDPERLRLEREELERRQREEKARLQAEAKAAEEARRKAEAEAMAEAKKKREQEREAARLALQKMEKTVDINENSQFMEDLEMLRAAPAEDISSFIDETSPDHSQNGLGSFKLQGSNPLEQLGLYMKADEDDEEDGEPQSVPDRVKDVEEGEID